MGFLRFARAHPDAVAFGILLTFVSSFGQTFFIGQFNDQIRAAFAISHGEFGTVYMIGTIGSAIALVWTGKRIDRMRLSTYVALVGAAMAVACLLMTLAQGLILLTLALFALRHAGQGLMSHTAVAAMVRRFDRNRGKAISLAAVGHPLGEALLPVASVAVVALVGWRAAWAAAAAISLLIVLPVSWWLVRRWDHGLAAGEDRRDADVQTDPAAPRDARAGDSWTRGQVLRDPRFYLLLPGVLAPSFVITGYLFHLQHIAAEKAWDDTVTALGFVGYAGAATAGAVWGGHLVDRHGARRVMPLFLPLLAAAAALLLLPAAWSRTGGVDILVVVAFLSLQGASAGVTFAAVSAGWAELYGPRHIGEVRALVVSLTIAASALAPPAMGLLFDAGVTAAVVSLGCIAYCGLGSVLIRLAFRPGRAPG